MQMTMVAAGSSNIAGLAIGAGSACLAAKLATRRVPDRRAPGAAIGLVAAAAVYPLARRRAGIDWPEALTLLSASGLALAAVKCPSRSLRILLGLSWIGHAIFDAAFRHDSTTSRLPRWYPASCAGFDIAYGARLIRADATG